MGGCLDIRSRNPYNNAIKIWEVCAVEKENVLAGTVGALLFALVGGALWFLLYQVGFLAGISGIVGVICAIKGYTFFSKSESLKGVIISAVAAVVVMVIAWYLCLTTDVYHAYQDWYASGEVDFTVTYAEAFRGARWFLDEPEIAMAYYKDLGIGLMLCVFGAFRYVKNAVKKVKQAKEVAPEYPVDVQ